MFGLAWFGLFQEKFGKMGKRKGEEEEEEGFLILFFLKLVMINDNG